MKYLIPIVLVVCAAIGGYFLWKSLKKKENWERPAQGPIMSTDQFFSIPLASSMVSTAPYSRKEEIDLANRLQGIGIPTKRGRAIA